MYHQGIIFTTLSGLGFGMMVWLGLGFGPTGDIAGPVTAVLAQALAGIGLVALAKLASEDGDTKTALELLERARSKNETALEPRLIPSASVRPD